MSYSTRFLVKSVFTFLIFFSLNLSAQQKEAETVVNNKNPFPTSYYSEIDRLLNLRSVAIAPTYDNVGGIYKAVADKKIKELVTEDHSWYLADLKLPAGEKNKKFRADWFEEQPVYTKKTILNSKADALISVIITKSSSGMTVNMVLYVKDGDPLISVTHQDDKTFEINKVNDIIADLYTKMKQRLPYNGVIMSRKGNVVTVNLGQKNGIKVNDQLTVAQVLAIKRHPKLKFMTNIEKEVIGQIVITKVDSDLSFAQINFEKEAGVIEKGSKLLPLNFVDYRNNPDGSITPAILETEKDAEEWLPAVAPQFGKISAALGISDYKISSVNQAGNGGYGTSQSFAPTIKLGGELWITSEWFAGLDIQRSIFSANNGLSGSAPTSLSFVTDQYDLQLGYRYALTGNFWGPQLHFGAGFFSSSTKVTDSAPVAFTSSETNGFQLQLGGYFPVTEDNKTAVGLRAKFMLFEKYSESPVNSGKGDPQMSNFGVYVTHQLTNNIQLRPEISYQLSTTTFSGTATRLNPVRSTEEKTVSYLVGIEYLF